tara:strand:- start:183 stop:383 length:201 start_codon:yes stop_codon:yes gene_type:complete
MTQRLDVHPTHPQARLLKVAAQALHQGELIAYPSDTTYALACHVGDKAAMENSYSFGSWKRIISSP